MSGQHLPVRQLTENPPGDQDPHTSSAALGCRRDARRPRCVRQGSAVASRDGPPGAEYGGHQQHSGMTSRDQT